VLSGLVEQGPAFVESELETVRAQLAGRQIVELRDASAPDLLRAFEEARWIHLSTHGVFREDNPMFSRLSARGDALFLIDLLERRFDAEMVVLSACNSGQVFSGEGDDLSGVAHGFLAAGAKRLVASIWRVHDQATRDWMATFYREMALPVPVSGDVGEMLRRACVRTREMWDHPFFWGAFCLYG
jgi:CHAT domain-containing protein